MTEKNAYIVGVSGGSASGKSTLCKTLVSLLPNKRTATLCSDTFFKRGHMPRLVSPLTGREGDDFNTPEAVDIAALTAALDALVSSGENEVVFVEGVTVFCFPELRERFDLKVFLELDTNIRMYRRIKRNMAERNLTLDEIADYFTEYAIFSEARYSLPSKIYADVILNGASYDKAAAMLARYIRGEIEG